MKFIHTADIHLDSPLVNLERYEGAPVEDARVATRSAFRNLVDLALQEEVDFVLIAGDLYDGDWKDYNTGLFFVSRMAELNEAGIGVYIVSGNHDAASRITRSLTLPGNAVVFSAKEPQTVVLEDMGVALHGQSYRTSAVTDNLASGYPRRQGGMFNIGILHTALTGREGHEPYAPCAPQELAAKEYDYWALGHVHRGEVVSKDPWVVFPGNTQGRHARETGAKGCVLVRVEGERVASVETRELDVLRWVTCEVGVEEEDDEDEVIGRVESELAGLLSSETERLLAVRVVIGGVCAAHGELLDRQDRIANEIRALAVDHGAGRAWVERVVLRTSMPPVQASAADDESVGGFLEAISCCEMGDELLRSLEDELSDLDGRLPAGMEEGAETVDLKSPEALRAYFESAKSILYKRMLRGVDIS